MSIISDLARDKTFFLYNLIKTSQNLFPKLIRSIIFLEIIKLGYVILQAYMSNRGKLETTQ